MIGSCISDTTLHDTCDFFHLVSFFFSEDTSIILWMARQQIYYSKSTRQILFLPRVTPNSLAGYEAQGG